MPGPIFSPFELWEDLLKLLIENFPNVESYEWALETYRSTSLFAGDRTQPPERVELALRRYCDYPEFYSGFATRSLAFLPDDSLLRIAMEQENADFFGALEQVPVPLNFEAAFPLPIFRPGDQVVFAEARHTFELQLRYTSSLFPQNPTATFLIYYWLCGLVASRMLRSYFADQVARLASRERE